MISKPEYLEQLLNSNVHLSKSDGYDLFKPWLGDGLLVSTGKLSASICMVLYCTESVRSG